MAISVWFYYTDIIWDVYSKT